MLAVGNVVAFVEMAYLTRQNQQREKEHPNGAVQADGITPEEKQRRVAHVAQHGTASPHFRFMV